MEKTKLKRYAAVMQKQCVACGCCVKVCPRGAIQIRNGMYAIVDKTKCIGCSLCMKACPASVIQMEVNE